VSNSTAERAEDRRKEHYFPLIHVRIFLLLHRQLVLVDVFDETFHGFRTVVKPVIAETVDEKFQIVSAVLLNLTGKNFSPKCFSIGRRRFFQFQFCYSHGDEIVHGGQIRTSDNQEDRFEYSFSNIVGKSHGR
jgi:hypothetical protein